MIRLLIVVGLMLLQAMPLVGATALINDQTEPHAGPMIRVGLWSGQKNVKLSGNAPLQLIDADSRQVLGEIKPGEVFYAATVNNGFTVATLPLAAKPVLICPATGSEDSTITVNDKQYRGQIMIKKTQDKYGLTVINMLPLEHYLYGVLPWEVSPEWPLEAQKAQAVAARTFALSQLRHYEQDGYDVTGDTRSQVYGGRSCEDARSNQAVDATAGIIMTYDAKPITAYFHSSSGGYTEDSENVWGNEVPYLRAVPDFDQNNPHYKWEKPYTAIQISALLRKAGHEIGQLRAVQLSALGQQPCNAPDRGVSGRVKSIKFIGTIGSIELTGNQVRSIFSLNSTLFDVALSSLSANPPSTDISITDSDGDHIKKTLEINTKPIEITGTLGANQQRILEVGMQPLVKLVFRGFGWGHGLGMSQWGAKAMADKGPTGDSTYFKQILQHYYQHIQFSKGY